MTDMSVTANQMNKSELIKRMSDKLDQLSNRDVDLAVHTLIEIMSASLASGGRIEIRGFGTFSNHFRKPRTVRNPKTGEVGIHKPGSSCRTSNLEKNCGKEWMHPALLKAITQKHRHQRKLSETLYSPESNPALISARSFAIR